jgi:hypothetical protein
VENTASRSRKNHHTPTRISQGRSLLRARVEMSELGNCPLHAQDHRVALSGDALCDRVGVLPPEPPSVSYGCTAVGTNQKNHPFRSQFQITAPKFSRTPKFAFKPDWDALRTSFWFTTGVYPGPRRVPIEVHGLECANSVLTSMGGRNGKEGARKLAPQAGLRSLDYDQVRGPSTRCQECHPD